MSAKVSIILSELVLNVFRISALRKGDFKARPPEWVSRQYYCSGIS